MDDVRVLERVRRAHDLLQAGFHSESLVAGWMALDAVLRRVADSPEFAEWWEACARFLKAERVLKESEILELGRLRRRRNRIVHGLSDVATDEPRQLLKLISKIARRLET